jgi:hypothetical protein
VRGRGDTGPDQIDIEVDARAEGDILQQPVEHRRRRECGLRGRRTRRTAVEREPRQGAARHHEVADQRLRVGRARDCTRIELDREPPVGPREGAGVERNAIVHVARRRGGGIAAGDADRSPLRIVERHTQAPRAGRIVEMAAEHAEAATEISDDRSRRRGAVAPFDRGGELARGFAAGRREGRHHGVGEWLTLDRLHWHVVQRDRARVAGENANDEDVAAATRGQRLERARRGRNVEFARRGELRGPALLGDERRVARGIDGDRFGVVADSPGQVVEAAAVGRKRSGKAAGGRKEIWNEARLECVDRRKHRRAHAFKSDYRRTGQIGAALSIDREAVHRDVAADIGAVERLAAVIGELDQESVLKILGVVARGLQPIRKQQVGGLGIAGDLDLAIGPERNSGCVGHGERRPGREIGRKQGRAIGGQLRDERGLPRIGRRKQRIDRLELVPGRSRDIGLPLVVDRNARAGAEEELAVVDRRRQRVDLERETEGLDVGSGSK